MTRVMGLAARAFGGWGWEEEAKGSGRFYHIFIINKIHCVHRAHARTLGYENWSCIDLSIRRIDQVFKVLSLSAYSKNSFFLTMATRSLCLLTSIATVVAMHGVGKCPNHQAGRPGANGKELVQLCTRCFQNAKKVGGVRVGKSKLWMLLPLSYIYTFAPFL